MTTTSTEIETVKNYVGGQWVEAETGDYHCGLEGRLDLCLQHRRTIHYQGLNGYLFGRMGIGY
ncbi:hypothetical protein GCM10025859_59220 [Alicyclobacillus fastidiosus]|nr:hypothetical protein GCM10025859_59220 [Alicyclobacillus fastidiosus]